MKTITESLNTDKWWIGRQPQCSSCQAIYEIEATDTPIKVYPVTCDVTALWECPACGNNLYEDLRKPSKAIRDDYARRNQALDALIDCRFDKTLPKFANE